MKIRIIILLSFMLKSALHAQQIKVADSFTAGQEVIFELHQQHDDPAIRLQVSSSLGPVLLRPILENEMLKFILPERLSRQAGYISWRLLNSDRTLQEGSLTITADTSSSQLEAYLGPKHLVVNKDDFAMLTTLIVDRYDNPFPTKTPYKLHTALQGLLKEQPLQTGHLTGFTNIGTPQKIGSGAVSVSYADATSKEFRLHFYTNDPSDFAIKAEREHQYADGNQLVTLRTSQITDSYGNQVENGTLVTFQISNTKGQTTVAQAQTINGSASISLPAPSAPTIWTISSNINGYANSNVISLAFEQAFKAINVTIETDKILFGPVKSYMGQFAKDGLEIQVTLIGQETKKELTLSLVNGIATLNFEKEYLPKGNYELLYTFSTYSQQLNMEVK